MTAAFKYYNSIDDSRYGREHLEDGSDPLLREFLSEAPRHSVVVELGSGKGAFAGIHEGYIAVDLSGIALHRFVHARGAKALQADIEQIPLRSGCVDFLFTFATLEHVPHPERVLAEIDRILAPGGRALLRPAWFCRPWAAKGIPIREYHELGWQDRLTKLSIPIRENMTVRLASVLPRRLFAELRAAASRRPTEFGYQRLRPNLRDYVYTDCDAFTSMDPHSAALYFGTRGYTVDGCERFKGRMRLRNEALFIRKNRVA